MLRDILKRSAREHTQASAARCGSRSLQLVLWSVWTLAVAATAYGSWQADMAAQRPANTLGLVIHSVLAGLIGLVIMTVIEMRLEPWRFME